MVIDALKSSGKIYQGMGLPHHLLDAVKNILINPEQVNSNNNSIKEIKNTLNLSKEWISEIEDHLKFFEISE